MLDEPNTTALALWTLLRWERKLAQCALVQMSVDLWQLQKRLDALLEQSQHVVFRSRGQVQSDVARSYANGMMIIDLLLDRAGQEAQQLGHNWIGTEHLLLAIITHSHPPLTDLLREFGILHEPTKAAIQSLLQS